MSGIVRLCSKLWNAEPIIMALLGSAAVWAGLFSLLAAFGHPLTDQQQHALVAIATAIAAILARSKAIAPDTHQEAINNIQKVTP